MSEQIIEVPGMGRVAFPANMSDADIVTAIKRNAPTGQQAKRGVFNSLESLDVGEAALSMGSAMLGGVVGPIAGVGRALMSAEKFGTPEHNREAVDTARNVMEKMTYRPRREGAQEILSGVGRLIDDSKIAGFPPAGAISLASMSGRSIPQAARRAPVPIADDMAGVGAAQTAIPTLRQQRAADLPVPMKLTKGQATRTFEQQQFEREAAKNPTIGEPLRTRFAEQNRQIPQNLEFFADSTGAEAGSLRATGEIVTNAIADKANTMKGKIDAAYTAARTKGEMLEPVHIAPLLEYLEAKKPQAINAPVLSSALDDISRTTKETGGFISLNDLEEVRKAIGVAGGKDATNAHYARELKGIIETMTEGAGGDAYKYARRLRSQYAKEFENVGIIDRLMSTKPGTKDRSVAFEDVFSKTILGGSLDDVRAVRKTLQTQGEKGQQAWRELQGATVNHLKEEVTKNAQRDIYGNPVVSPAQFNKIVTDLDKDGKLDFIFGKQGGQKIRDLRDISLDVMTSPPGSVNTSNTASVVLAALDTIMSGSMGLPLPIGSAIHYGVRKAKDASLGKKVKDALQ